MHKNIEYGGSGSSKAHDLKLLTLHWLEVALCLSADSPNLNKIVAASSNLQMHVIQLKHKWWIKGMPMFSYNDVRSLFTTYSSCPRDYGSENSLVPIFNRWYMSDNIKKKKQKKKYWIWGHWSYLTRESCWCKVGFIADFAVGGHLLIKFV